MRALEYLQRAAYLLSIAAFALPFLAVKGCQSKAVREYSGYELLGESGGWLYLVPIGLGLLLFGVSFLLQRGDLIVRGFISAMKAILSSAAEYVVSIHPNLQFVFDSIHSRLGQHVAAASWVLVYAVSLAGTLAAIKRTWPPPSRVSVPGPRRGPVRAVFWLLVVLTLGIFAISVVLSGVTDGYIRSILIRGAAGSIPLYLALYLVDLEFNRQKRWPAIWVVFATFSALAAGGVILLTGSDLYWLFIVAPIVAMLVGVAGLAACYFPPLQRRKSVGS